MFESDATMGGHPVIAAPVGKCFLYGNGLLHRLATDASSGAVCFFSRGRGFFLKIQNFFCNIQHV